MGAQHIKSENTVLRVEITRPPFVHAVQIATAAKIQQEGREERTCALLDVDTIRIERWPVLTSFSAQLPALLDEIHLANKRVFFECISTEGLASLEPKYE